MPEELDYAPRISLPTEGELSPSEINQLISTATTLRKIDQESRAAARRYRGQQQLQTLIQQGVPMEKAMMQVSGDLFYNNPAGFVSWHQTEENRKLRELSQKRLEQQAAAMDLHRSIMEAQGQQRIDKPPKPDLTPLRLQLSGVNTRIGQSERKMSAAESEEDRASFAAELDALYGERETIQQAIKEAGGQVAITGRPTFETKPVVTVPPDRRGWKAYIPFIGPKAPGPITNMVTRMVPPALPTAPVAPAAQPVPTADPANFRIPPSTPVISHPDVGPAEAPPSPLPKDKKQLVPGQKYITRQGVATWDGEQFVQE